MLRNVPGASCRRLIGERKMRLVVRWVRCNGRSEARLRALRVTQRFLERRGLHQQPTSGRTPLLLGCSLHTGEPLLPHRPHLLDRRTP